MRAACATAVLEDGRLALCLNRYGRLEIDGHMRRIWLVAATSLSARTPFHGNGAAPDNKYSRALVPQCDRRAMASARGSVKIRVPSFWKLQSEFKLVIECVTIKVQSYMFQFRNILQMTFKVSSTRKISVFYWQ